MTHYSWLMAHWLLTVDLLTHFFIDCLINLLTVDELADSLATHDSLINWLMTYWILTHDLWTHCLRIIDCWLMTHSPLTVDWWLIDSFTHLLIDCWKIRWLTNDSWLIESSTHDPLTFNWWLIDSLLLTHWLMTFEFWLLTHYLWLLT